MIDWKSIEEFNPLPNVSYLVYLPVWWFDKDVVQVAVYFPDDDEWRVSKSWTSFDGRYVTHFAEYNIPIREKNES